MSNPATIKASSYRFIEQILRCMSLYEDLDVYECQDFWYSEEIINWFKGHGYTLYKRAHQYGPRSWQTTPSLAFEMFAEADYPYAFHNAEAIDEGDGRIVPLRSAANNGRILYAQDDQLRHVAIKVVHVDSEEFRIVTFLREQTLETMRENSLLPIIDIIYLNKVCFAVMPRWGGHISEPKSHTVRDMLCMLQCALKVSSNLKALAFLHSHKIIYRDVSINNILVNHFGDGSEHYFPLRQPQLSAGLLTYALIDFDIAMMLPPSTDMKTFRLPSEKSFEGGFGPDDTMGGQRDSYNPFAYDVGCLGMLFCELYQHHCTDVPLLAPLLDMMVTRDIEKRFTASEALHFVGKVLAESDPVQLSVVERPRPGIPYTMYDRWAGLSDVFQQKWKAYREPLRDV